MAGRLYGVGVGPGDPELLTLKAARVIGDCDLIAVPDSGGDATALHIARGPIGDKPVLRCRLPMTRDEALLEQCREKAADLLCRELAQGKDVAFLTLGDPGLYSTYSYLHARVVARGFSAEIIPGVPSFCAAAAALGVPLCEGGQPLHVLPASYPGALDALSLPGVRVLMKSGRQMDEVLEALAARGLLGRARLAERVGMEGERLCHKLDSTAGSSEYFQIVIVEEERL